MDKPTKDNTLFLTIQQKYFDQILSGAKTKEYREIKETTFRKYLEMWKEGDNEGIYYDDELASEQTIAESCNDPMIWNNGVYPYIPIEYKYITFAGGKTAPDMDKMTIAVKDITFHPAEYKKGQIARFNWSEESGFEPNVEGKYCLWQIVYHLGQIASTDLKKDRK